MQTMKASSGEQSQAQHQLMQQMKDELVKERGELRARNEDMELERAQWSTERARLQKDLDAALASRDAAVLASSQSAAAAAELAKEAELQEKLGNKDAEMEMKVREKEAELEARAKAEQDARLALTSKDAELEERMRAESEARSALEQKAFELQQKDQEIATLKEQLSQQFSDLDSKAKEIGRQAATIEGLQSETNRLGQDLQKHRKDREDVFNQLSDMRGEHMQLREQHAKTRADMEDFEASSKEKVLGLEGLIREQKLCIKKLEDDLLESQATVKDLEECRQRAERADRMLAPLNQRIEELHKAFAQEQTLRKRYHNQMQEAKGAIRVYARIRPSIAREAGEELAAKRIDAFSMELLHKDKRVAPKVYNFDAVFDEHNTQEEVFSDCRGLVSSAIDGFNVTIFAYGQTGAGKTHTMYGSDSAPGLVPRIAQEIFEVLGKYAHEAQALVHCSMFELYRDDLVDLFQPKVKGKAPPILDIKKDTRGSVYVDNATLREAGSAADLLKIIQEGQDRRHVSATKMNTDSSRSHLIAIISIESTNRKTKQVAVGKLTLCDLAGSERLKKSEASGDQLKEAQSINKSLSALGDVIEALTKHAKHVPYRNHKLTQLLSDSLGGNAKTLMFVNCSPVESNADETGAALGYAARAKLIMNKVEKNQDSQEVARLKKVIQIMNQELEQARQGGTSSVGMAQA
mmetsp:Transcript_14426/g.31243  ORF Transcript_14426/g.31243 Transcript_14426/m.31243 type:complete len:693 (+) Transcript_14426:1-2079(+)